MLLFFYIFSSFQCKDIIGTGNNTLSLKYSLTNANNIGYYIYAYIGTPSQEFLLYLTTYTPVTYN